MQTYLFGKDIIYCFTSDILDENSYVIIKDNKALIIDPNATLEQLTFLKENHIENVTVLLTHEHFDHTKGLPLLKENFLLKVMAQRQAAISIFENNKEHYRNVSIMLMMQDNNNKTKTLNYFEDNYSVWSYKIKNTFDDDLNLEFEEHKFYLKHTPGHSPGSTCITMDNSVLFCGDTLFKDRPTITRLPGGSTKDFKNMTVPYLKSLDKELLVLPGHYQSFKLKDKAF